MKYTGNLLERWTRALQEFLTAPQGSETSPASLRQLDDLVLYHYRGCPFCARVERVLGELGIRIEMRNILSDKSHEAELIRGGGKRQVPCLRIRRENQDDEWLYESTAIIRYLRSHLD